MDSDDISLPTRLEKQVAFLESHPEIGLCGTYSKTFGKVNGLITKPPVNHDEILAGTLFRMGVCNPTILIRRNILVDNKIKITNKFIGASDYLFITDVLDKTKLANIPQVLSLYRVNSTSVSNVHKDEQSSRANEVRKMQLLKMMPSASEDEIKLHLQISSSLLSTMNFKTNIFKKNDLDLNKVLAWFEKLIKNNRKNKKIDEHAFRKVLSEEWVYICGSNLAPFTWLKSIFLSIFKRDSICFTYSIWFILKTILRFISNFWKFK